MRTARARHIFVKNKILANKLKQQLDAGADFEALAQQHSQCPSGKKGGDLGEFKAGDMVRPFDNVVFKKAMHQVHGPIKTQYGYHLIETLERS